MLGHTYYDCIFLAVVAKTTYLILNRMLYDKMEILAMMEILDTNGNNKTLFCFKDENNKQRCNVFMNKSTKMIDRIAKRKGKYIGCRVWM